MCEEKMEKIASAIKSAIRMAESGRCDPMLLSMLERIKELVKKELEVQK